MTLAEYLSSQEFDLSLSAGFFGFYAHLGFLRALHDFNLRPQSLFGSSAGAIAAAFYASGMSLAEIEDVICGIKFRQVMDIRPGFGLLRGQKFQNLLERNLPSSFEKLEVPISVSVFNLNLGKNVSVASGPLPTIVRASSAFPILFQPVRHEAHYFTDGGVTDEYGISERGRQNPLLVFGFSSKPIFKSSFERLKRQNGPKYLIYFNELTKAHPFAMHKGPQIIQQAYCLAKEALLQEPEKWRV